MARKILYTEIRILHESPEDKKIFEDKLKSQATTLTNGNVRSYIKLLVELNAASKLIKYIGKSKWQ